MFLTFLNWSKIIFHKKYFHFLVHCWKFQRFFCGKWTLHQILWKIFSTERVKIPDIWRNFSISKWIGLHGNTISTKAVENMLEIKFFHIFWKKYFYFLVENRFPQIFRIFFSVDFFYEIFSWNFFHGLFPVNSSDLIFSHK